MVVVGALFGLVKTIGNRHSRAVICTHGIACITTKTADTARWEDILTIVHGVNVTTTRHQTQGGGSYTTTSVSHTFTVHCYDGRKILFDSTSCGKVEELGETIQVELARRGLPKGVRA